MFIHAKGIVADTLNLTAHGVTVMKVEYKFNATLRWQEVMALRVELAKMSEQKKPDYEKIGEKVITLFGIVFGADTTKEMLGFFDGCLENLVETLTPVFKVKIYPACEQARKRAIKARKAAK